METSEMHNYSAYEEMYKAIREKLLETYDKKALAEVARPLAEELKIVPGMHENRSTPQEDDKNKMDIITQWYLGQLIKMIESEEEDLTNMMALIDNPRRYNTDEYFGRDMHELFARAKLERGRTFSKEYSPHQGWLDPGEPLNSEILPPSIAEIADERKRLAGRELAVYSRPEFPDQPAKTVVGKLLTDWERGNAIFFLELPTGERIEMNTNNVIDLRVKDISDPPYREIVSQLKKDGYIDTYELDAVGKDAELVYLVPDKESGTWKLKKGTAEDQINLRGGNAIFSVLVLGKTEKWSLNNIGKLGSGRALLVKPKIVS